MKLNLSIIYDELYRYGCEMIATETIEMNLEGFQILPDKGLPLLENVLYLCDARSINHIQYASPSLNFLVYGADPSEYFIEQMGHNVLFLKDMGLSEALLQISSVFERYQKWDSLLCQALLNQNSIEEIFNLCAGFLKNPIAFFDMNYVLIFLAGQLPEDIQCTSWEETVTQGYAAIENYQKDEKREVIDYCKKTHQPYVFVSSFYGKLETKVVSFLFRGDKILGNLSTSDILAPLSNGQICLIYHMQKILEKVLIKEATSTLWEDSENNLFLSKIIEGIEVRQDVLHHFLAKKHWQNKKLFRLILFIEKKDDGIEPFIVHHATYNIGMHFKDSMIVTYHNEILAIIQDDEFQIPEDLKAYLEKVQLQSAISFTFSDFIDLRLAYRQCRETLTAVTPLSFERPLFFGNYYFKVMLDQLSKNIDLRCFCDQRLVEIGKMKTNGIEWIRSVYCYLMAGRSISVAAKIMGIHRNTMHYRISQVSERIGCELSELDDENSFILAFTCLILIHE